MILAFIGAILLLAGVCMEGTNVIVIVIGAILLILGLCATFVQGEEMKAHRNRREYWAHGKLPDWAKKDK